VNQVIHVTCVPVIYTTALSFLSRVPLPAAMGALVPAVVRRAVGAAAGTWALPAAAGYAGYYLSLAPGPLGASAAALALAALPASTALLRAFGMRVAVGAHVVSWLAQFVGHGVYEGRSPALLDNLFQAIFMAPFFVCAWEGGTLFSPQRNINHPAPPPTHTHTHSPLIFQTWRRLCGWASLRTLRQRWSP
jgi:uncharacterized membrane protein YGL010W